MPTPVRWAVRLMYAGAVLSVPVGLVFAECLINFIVGFENIDSADPTREQVEGTAIPILLLAGCAVIAVAWLWARTARKIRSGDGQGRKVTINWFCLAVLILAFPELIGWSDADSLGMARWIPRWPWGFGIIAAYWAVGLAVIILLFLPGSGQFFRNARQWWPSSDE